MTNDSSLSRRRLLQAAAAASAGLAGCGPDPHAVPAEDIEATAFGPLPPQEPPLCRLYAFFTQEEAETVDAIAARLVPGTPDDPGAREACAVTFIDTKLAQFTDYDQPTYDHAPFPVEVDDEPGEQPGATKEIRVNKDVLPRHGFQSSLDPQAAYRNGLPKLDEYCTRRFGGRFTALTERRQDTVLEALERGDAGFDDPAPDDFFEMLRDDVLAGVFADPTYGGNRDLIGWRLIDYPGPQRAYTPRELRRGTAKRPQTLRDLHPTHPGHPNPDALHVMSGTRQERR